MPLADGDMLIHCGDWSKQGRLTEAISFLNWFGSQPHQHKIAIAGNHDWICERDPHLFRSMLPENVIYLEDSGIEIEGVKIWGTPQVPEFGNWAFNQSEERLGDYFSLIPDDTQILISHGPPHGILDRLSDGTSVGSIELGSAIKKLPQLKLLICGHIHESFGQAKINDVQYINVALLDEKYRIKNKPWIIDFSENKVSLSNYKTVSNK
jgi:Icc-related predicted phosphoesterase